MLRREAEPMLTAPAIPPELANLYDDSAAQVYEQWNAKSAADVTEAFPYSSVNFHSDQSIRYADLRPHNGDFDPEETAVMTLPAGKTWDPETFITASVIRELTVPTGRLLVFPNNNNGQRSYSFSKEERRKIAEGDLSPLSERQIRVCEVLGIDSLALVLGHSFGATAGAAFSNRASEYIQLHANGFNEAPNTFADQSRTAVALRKAMMREREFVKPAIKAIGLPAFNEVTGVDHGITFGLNLVRYAVGANTIAPNREINRAFLSDSFSEDVILMLAGSETATVSLSNAESSTVCSIEATAAVVESANAYPGDTVASYTIYDGYHVAGGNPFVLGLLGRKARIWHDGVERAGQDFGAIDEVAKEHAQPDQD